MPLFIGQYFARWAVIVIRLLVPDCALMDFCRRLSSKEPFQDTLIHYLHQCNVIDLIFRLHRARIIQRSATALGVDVHSRHALVAVQMIPR